MKNMFLKRNIHAFTLAEILIVIGIVGIVSALTIPTLIKNYQKRSTINRLKKAYSELQQVVKLAENDNGEISGWDFTGKIGDEFADRYLAPYIKSTKTIVPTLQDYNYKKVSGKVESGLVVTYNPVSCYQLFSGATTCFLRKTTNTIGNGFILDLNGYNSPPNQFGKDAFFLLISNVGLMFYQKNDNEPVTITRTVEELKGYSYYGYQCSKNSRGMWCGALIQRSGWTIPKDYPW
jgi:prepilin-type N-terminal cleavage/methylation domain-containing protein